jgi:uncharacterized protein (TIGR02611 family)
LTSEAGQVGTNPDETASRPLDDPPSATVDDPPSATVDDLPLRHPFRAFFARHRTLNLVYRVVVGVVGAAIVLGGIVLIPLPGPGWLIVFAGLALLSTEFEWAGRLLDFARRQVLGWTDWVRRQSLLVRAAISLGGLALVAGAVWLYVTVQGVPEWVPLG